MDDEVIGLNGLMKPEIRPRSGASTIGSGAIARKPLRTLLEKPEVKSWRALMAAFQTIYRQLEKALLIEDCSIPRFQILFSLYFEGPLPPSEIAKRLLVTRGNISMFLKRLQADGIIRPVRANAVQKRPFFELTKKGAGLFEGVFPQHVARVRRLMPSLSQSSLDMLRGISEPPSPPLARSRARR